MADALSRALEQRGHNVMTAKTFAEGVACARTGDFKLVISDLQLPDSSSQQTADNIDQYGLPVIVLTAFNDIDIEKQLRAKGIAVEHKPVRFETLHPRILEMLDPHAQVITEETHTRREFPANTPPQPQVTGETRVNLGVTQMIALIGTIVAAAWWVAGKTNEIGMSVIRVQSEQTTSNAAITRQLDTITAALQANTAAIRANDAADTAREKATSDRIGDWTPWRWGVVHDLRALGTATKTPIETK